MANMQIYHSENNTNYSFSADIRTTLLSSGTAGGGTGTYDYYLLVSTSIPKTDGSSFLPAVIRTLSDVPPSGFSPPASNFTELMQWWLEYYLNQAELGFSSSSSSSTASSESSSSSLSSLSSESSSFSTDSSLSSESSSVSTASSASSLST